MEIEVREKRIRNGGTHDVKAKSRRDRKQVKVKGGG